MADGGVGGDYRLTVYQDEARTDYTSMWVDVANSTISAVDFNLDIFTGLLITRP